MVSRRKKRKRARTAVGLAQSAVGTYSGERVVLPEDQVEVLERVVMALGDNILDSHQSGPSVDRGVLTETVGRIDAAYGNVPTSPLGIGDDRANLMIGYTRLGIILYLSEMGRADLRKAFGEVVNDVESPTPFDVDAVNGLGISEREPSDLSETRPYGEQHLSRTDLDLIVDLALLIAVGDAAENTLQALTWMELEAMSGAAGGILRNPNQFSSKQLAGIPRLRELVHAEIDRRYLDKT